MVFASEHFDTLRQVSIEVSSDEGCLKDPDKTTSLVIPCSTSVRVRWVDPRFHNRITMVPVIKHSNAWICSSCAGRWHASSQSWLRAQCALHGDLLLQKRTKVKLQFKSAINTPACRRRMRQTSTNFASASPSCIQVFGLCVVDSAVLVPSLGLQRQQLSSRRRVASLLACWARLLQKYVFRLPLSLSRLLF